MRSAALAAVAVAALLGWSVPAAAAGGARGALDEGLALFEARRYEEAAVKFEEAAAKAGAAGLDPALAGYNRAIALLKGGKAVEAAEAFTAVLRSPDPRLRESAQYQRGIALATAADASESRGDLRKAVALLEEALGAYESAMLIDPGDEDPKVNHELASRKLAQLAEKLRQQAGGGGRGDRSQADDAGPGQRPPEQGERERRPAQQRPAEKEMRPDEARTLLDALRQQELSQRSRTRPFRGATVPVEKNW